MKVLVQHSLATPADWEAIDVTPSGKGSRAWTNLAKKPVPTNGETIDNSKGWIYDVAVMGVWCGGTDCYAVEPLATGGVKVTCWNEDAGDWWGQSPRRYARVMEFHPGPPWQITKTYYTEAEAPVHVLGEHASPTGDLTVWLPWALFVRPAETLVRYGIWLPDALNDQHVAVRRIPAYLEWLV